MDVLHVVHQVAGDHHAGLGMRGRQGLRLAQEGRPGRVVVGVRSDLGEVERQLGFPRRSPAIDHPGEELPVGAMVGNVALALIPNHPGDAERCDGLDHGVERQPRLVRPPGDWFNFRGAGPEVRVVFNDAARRPDLRWSTAPVAVNQAHGQAQFLVQALAEKIPNRAEVKHLLRGANDPSGRQVILRCLGRGLRYVKEPDHGVRGPRGLLLGLAQSLIARPLHVALAAANPHLADQHILEHDLSASFDADRVRPAGLRCLDLGRPAPAVGGRGFPYVGGPTNRHRDGLRGSGPSPEGRVGVLLQHHVRTDDRGQAHGGGERSNEQAQSSEEQEHSFHDGDRR